MDIEESFITDEDLNFELRVRGDFLIAIASGIIAKTEFSKVALNVGGRSFIELGNCSFNLSEKEARKVKVFLHKVTSKFSWEAEE